MAESEPTKLPEYNFIASYPCHNHCEVEIDLSGSDVNRRQTIRMLADRADAQHEVKCAVADSHGKSPDAQARAIAAQAKQMTRGKL